MTGEQVMKELEKDSAFYEQSGGGVTFTGGEPFMQFDFLLTLLSECRKSGIHTAIETCGYTPWENLYEASKYTRLFLYDLKLMDDEKHKHYTGVSNALILDNLKKIAENHDNICVRIPLIPGINDDEDNIRKTCEFLRETNIRLVDILPYHNTGMYKYRKLGLDYRLKDTGAPEKNSLDKVVDVFRKSNFTVSVGGGSK